LGRASASFFISFFVFCFLSLFGKGLMMFINDTNTQIQISGIKPAPSLPCSELIQHHMAEHWNRTYAVGQRVVVQFSSGRSLMAVTSSKAHVVLGQAVIALASITSCQPVALITAL
jgi:hypothetical protein